jgi:uncharacterized protein
LNREFRALAYVRRLVSLLAGICLYGLGIVLTIRANIGYAPWDVFHRGVGNALGMTLGNVSILAGLFICAAVMLMGEKLGLGTVLNMFLIGKTVDLLLSAGLIPEMKGFLPGAAFMILGLFTIAVGSYFYIRSGFGAGPRDSLMVALRRKTKFPIGLCRGAIEFFVVAIGWALGGPVGPGTLIAAFGISACVQIVFSLFGFDAATVAHESLDVTFRQLKTIRNR